MGIGSNPQSPTISCKKLEIIEYYYYSMKLSESKSEKNVCIGIKLIKEFIKNMYYTYGKQFNKKDN